MSNRKRKHRGGARGGSIAPQPAFVRPLTVSELQAASYQVATTWFDGLNVDLFGVNLGQCLVYSVIQALNQALAANAGQPTGGQAHG